MKKSAARARSALKGFRRRSGTYRRVLERTLGAPEAAAVVKDATHRYEVLAPEVATIPRGMMNGALISTYEYLAYAKALEARGHGPDVVGTFFQDAYSALVDRVPSWVGRVIFRLAGPWMRRRMKKEAQASLESSDEGGWRFEYVEGAKGTADFGFDVKECAVCSAFQRHDASQYVPYLCALDDKMSDTMGMGLKRSGTLALGASRCDFRFSPGGEPQRLVQLTPRDEESEARPHE